jgi:hypothetical protein
MQLDVPLIYDNSHAAVTEALTQAMGLIDDLT